MSGNPFLVFRAGQPIPRSEIPELSFPDFRHAIIQAAAGDQKVVALFGDHASEHPTTKAEEKVDFYAILANSTHSLLRVGKSRLQEDRYPALTRDCPQVHLFERELAEQYGIRPERHPWLKPVRFHSSYRSGHNVWRGETKPIVGLADYYTVEGEEIHEVGVGPVHAGIIEPGHFRFQCHGELVIHLEVSLGYQHRGAERSIMGGPTKRTIHTMETMAGDTTIGHATAYCQAIEALSGRQVPIRAEVLRGIGLELERLANHTGDLGALAGDIGFLPTASYCGRLRGDFLNLTALLCGSRFGRGLVRPGGVAFDLDEDRKKQFQERLRATFGDVENAVNLLWESASVQARFEGVGVVSPQVGRALGLVGPAARASGLECDIRQDFPSGIYRFVQVPVSTSQTGDVFARAYVRWLEIQRSVAFIREQLEALPDGPVLEEIRNQESAVSSQVSNRPLAPNRLKADHFVVTLVEGWRGQICHVALTDAQGLFSKYKIVDPSFHNWMGLALALRNQQISDFPLCNKSFNLSYCGHDL